MEKNEKLKKEIWIRGRKEKEGISYQGGRQENKEGDILEDKIGSKIGKYCL